MFHTVLRYCEDEKLIETGDLVLTGVSGGADSVCLLLLLKELQKEMSFSLGAIHVEHGIRGEESLRDVAFVEALCEELSVPLQVYRVEAPAYAAEHGLGLEEAARELRYDCFKRAARAMQEKNDANQESANLKESSKCSEIKIALAHHGDDNAETVLFQMIRGSGIDGLCGIWPKRTLEEHVTVIRPLLGITRLQIEDYLRKHNQSYCIDSTNQDVVYSRNKLRREVLPLLTEINTQAVSHMNQSAAYLREVSDYLEQQVKEAAKLVFQEEEGRLLIQKHPLQEQPELIQKELLHLALAKAAGGAKDITAKHVKALGELFQLQVGRILSMPYGICAKRVYEGVVLCKDIEGDSAQANCSTKQSDIFFSVEKDELTRHLQAGSFEVELPGGKICFELLERTKEPFEILKLKYTKCLDYDKMKGSFQVRTRRSGDYLTIDDNQHTKRLKEYFINEKISSEVRNQILLFTEESKVLWVIGGRISADMKISERTTKVLKIQITGGNYYED